MGVLCCGTLAEWFCVPDQRERHACRLSHKEKRRKGVGWCLWTPKLPIALRNAPGSLVNVNSEVPLRLFYFSCQKRLNSGLCFLRWCLRDSYFILPPTCLRLFSWEFQELLEETNLNKETCCRIHEMKILSAISSCQILLPIRAVPALAQHTAKGVPRY